MKILRILRRKKIRLSYIFLLLLFFIFNTYAWMRTDKDTDMGNLTLNVDDWSVAFIVENEEIKTEEYTFEIEEFYPGITTEAVPPIEKKIDVYNIGNSDSNLKYEITEIYLYGEQIYNKQIGEGEQVTFVPETIGTETTGDRGEKTVNLFGNEEATIFDENNTNYTFSLRYPTPFTISYTYDKTYVTGKNQEESATSWMTINLAWYNDEDNNEEDTRLGNMVYEFENAKDAQGNLINEGEPALRIVTRVTATKVDEGVSYQ